MDAILECKNLTKKYGSKTALDNISLSLPRSSIIGLLGPNGSGKTTLMKLAAGILTPTSGEILICNEKPGVITKSLVSYQPDKVYLNDWMNVHDLIHMISDFYTDFDKTKAYEMLKSLDIEPQNRLKTMSKGTKEKVQLIMTMSRKSELYLLDEPIGGVDPAARDYILDTIISNYKENASVVLSTHLIHDIEPVLNHIIFVKKGHVVRQGEADAIREEKGMSIDELFREEFKC